MNTPGTVSKILWHFTGGPAWNAAENCQSKVLKPLDDAFSSLLSIVRTQELRLGNYKEVVKVKLKELEKYNHKLRAYETHHDVIVPIESSPVCCIADIPLMHLGYHAQRYGKFAIGFHREAVLKFAFNPVFYTLHDTAVARAFHKIVESIGMINIDQISEMA